MARPLRRPGNLPAEATSFIGRRRELADLRRTLGSARLVTLAGPGGVGKTRLAIHAASELARRFHHGAWLVELADVRDPALIDAAFQAALDLRDQVAAEPRALLRSYLRERELLLVVDNCEHLLPAAAGLVAEILEVAPRVRVIATSREPLSVPAEHVLPIAPLQLPRPDDSEPLELLALNESVELFVERAAAASGRFALTTANRAAVVDLCRRLDGLPLAIELAAVRTRVLSVDQIEGRLADRFALLTGGSRAALPRHQTLRTTLEWSHDLLGPDERVVLRRLCVFAGRFTLDDVEGVCASDDVPPARMLDVVASLVDKSLVQKEDLARGAWFRLHETMREFAALKLREAGEEEAVERRCVDHYVTTCGRTADGARFDLVAWLAWLELELDTIRSVLSRCLAHGDVASGLALMTSLRWLWATRATTEGVRWLEEYLATGRGDPDTRADAEYLLGFLAVLLVDPATACPALDRATAGHHGAGRRGPLATSLAMASIAATMAGDRPAALRLIDEAHALEAQMDDVVVTLTLLQARAIDGLFSGDLEAVAVASTEGARLSREIGDLYTLKVWLLNLGTIGLITGDGRGAQPLLEESLRIAHEVDDRVQLSYLLDALACVTATSRTARTTAQLFGAAQAIREGTGANPMPFIAAPVAQARATAIAALGTSRFDAAVVSGRRLDRDAAVRLALGDADDDHAQPAGRDAGVLSTREREVAELVAEGLSNKEIGARLVISEHTVDSHVRGILNKLGFDTRARIAAWVASEGR